MFPPLSNNVHDEFVYEEEWDWFVKEENRVGDNLGEKEGLEGRNFCQVGWQGEILGEKDNL